MNDKTSVADTVDEANPEAAPVPQHKGLKAAVIIMGVMLVIGFLVLLGTVVYKAMQLGGDEKPQISVVEGYFGLSRIPIGKGDEVGRMSMSDGRLAVRVTGSGYDEIIIIDLASGRELGRVRLGAFSNFAENTAGSGNAPQ